MIHTPVNVFIDTNIVIGNGYDFKNGALRWLKQLYTLRIVDLFTSSIVVSEVESHIRDDLQLASSETRNFIRKQICIKGLKGSEQFSALFGDFREQGWDTYTLNQWIEYIDDTDCLVLETNSVSLQDVLSDYFNGIAPFEEKQKKKYEFPDAIIIKSIKEFVNSGANQVFVITKDKGWINAFSNFRNVIVVDDIIDILKEIYSDVDPKIAKRIIDSVESISETIISRIEELIVDGQSYELDREYDEILEISFDGSGIEFITIETLSDENASVILQSNEKVVVTYSFIDYDNSPYDNETGEYVYLNSVDVTEEFLGRTEIVVFFNVTEDKSFEFENFEFLNPFEFDDSSKINVF